MRAVVETQLFFLCISSEIKSAASVGVVQWRAAIMWNNGLTKDNCMCFSFSFYFQVNSRGGERRDMRRRGGETLSSRLTLVAAAAALEEGGPGEGR